MGSGTEAVLQDPQGVVNNWPCGGVLSTLGTAGQAVVLPIQAGYGEQ